MSKKVKSIPFEFVLEKLYSLEPEIKPMFGCHAIYIKNKMVLMLRLKEQVPHDNGVWVASTPEHYLSLKETFPSLRPVSVLGETVTSWQNLPYESDDFESSAMEICDLICKNDVRIGKIPKKKAKPKKR
jgi:hypothetical protein